MTTPDLDCPAGENYGAIALQMRETALQVEQRLYTVERSLRAAANAYTHVQQTTAARTGLSTTGFHDIAPNFVTFTTPFSNWPGWNFLASIPAIPGAGEYQVGMCANLVASGAVTDNSHRIVRISQLRSTSSGTVTVESCQETIFEANVGGGMDVTVSGTFDMQLGDMLKFELNHGNAGSTLNVSSGALYWVTYRSSTDTVEVF